MSGKNNSLLFWLGFFTGGLLGAGVIFLMATKKGKMLAKNLTNRLEEIEDTLETKAASLKEEGEKLIEKAQEGNDFPSQIDETLAKIEDMQKKGTALTEELRHRFFHKDGKQLVS